MKIVTILLLVFSTIQCHLHAELERYFKTLECKSNVHQMKNIDFIYEFNLKNKSEAFDPCIEQLHPYGIYPYRFSGIDGFDLSLDAINKIGVKLTPNLKGGFPGITYSAPDELYSPLYEKYELIKNIGRTYFALGMHRGAIAYIINYLSILQDAIDSGYETIWVLETNVQAVQNPNIIPDLIDRLDMQIGKENWDILFTDLDYRNANNFYIPAAALANRLNFHPQNPEKCLEKTIISDDFRKVGARYGTYSMIIRKSGMVKILNHFKTYDIFLPLDQDIPLIEDIQQYTVLQDVVTNKEEVFVLQTFPQPLPSKLNRVLREENHGLVQDIKRVSIAEISNPLNGSIIEYNDGYLLFFMHNPKPPFIDKAARNYFRTNIGCVLLDRSFEQASPVHMINTNSDFSQDARVHKIDNHFYISYNQMVQDSIYCKNVFIARFYPESFLIAPPIELDFGVKPTEKNWIPFEYSNQSNKNDFLFIYNFNPHTILKVDNANTGKFSQFSTSKFLCSQEPTWIKNWGMPRGGTPAKLVDGKYLSFFHSFFVDEKGVCYYVMGAYTFEPEPPFRITAVSKNPILFEGIYDTTSCKTSRDNLQCIFPMGFVTDTINGKDVIHISAGENDCGIKIITIDKKVLFDDLEVLEPFPLYLFEDTWGPSKN